MTFSGAVLGPRRVPRKMRLIALIAATAGLLVGYNTAVISGVLPSMKQTWELDPTTRSLIVSGLLIGAILGAFIGGRLADDLGRRDVIMATAAVFALGTFGCGLAPSPVWLVMGRLVIGFAVGIVSVAVPLYLAEIAPAHRRGVLVGLYQLGITLGILFAYIVDAFLGATAHEWREMFLGGAWMAMLLGLAMLALPDSPRWMLLQDDEQEARDILRRLGVDDVDREVESIKRGIAEERSETLSDLARPMLRSPIGFGVVLFFFQQLGGINAVIYYGPTIFIRVGLAGEHEALMGQIAIGFLNFVVTIVSLMLIDRVGRRKLAMRSLAGMVVSLVVLCVGEWLFDAEVARGITGYALFFGFLSYVSWFAIGMGPICWIMISELYPLRLRGSAMGIPAMCHWGFNLLVAGSLPFLMHSGVTVYAFLAYAAFSAWGYAWVRKELPETMGLSLEDIQRVWISMRSKTA